MPAQTLTRRLLGSPFVDLLLGPYGVDRYLELIRPDLTLRDARARVISIERQTPRSVTLTLRPNAAFAGFQAGQYLPVGGEITFLHFARTREDWLYRPLVERLAAQHPGVRAVFRATREGGGRLDRELVRRLCGEELPDAAVCGPPALLDAARELWAGAPER